MNQRLAAGKRHKGRVALIHRVEAFFYGQPLIEDGVGIIDLATADACQVATKQGLQHQDEWIALAPGEPLLEQIGADFHFFEERDLHGSSLTEGRAKAVGSRGSDEMLANSGGNRNSIVSSGPFNVETSTGPSRRSQFTPPTSTSGAE